MQISENESNNFFRIQWYLSQVQKISMEWDSLIIVPQKKIIINIEIKPGPSVNALKKAASQANIHLRIFKKVFGAYLSQEWKFVKAAYIPNISLKIGDSLPCEYCKQFLITDIEKLYEWIKKLKYPDNEIFTPEDYKEEYENLLVGVIGYSALRQSDTLNKKIVDPYETIKATKMKVTASESLDYAPKEESKGSKSEYLCYMLTPSQLMAIKDPSSHIIIQGDYGCGKTYVLKERTKQCAEKYPDEKIAYINLTSDNYNSLNNLSIMDLVAVKNFKDYNNVDVITVSNLFDYYSNHKEKLNDVKEYFSRNGEECSLVISHFLKETTYNHIFIDEMPPFKKLVEFCDFFSLHMSFCVTLKCDDSFDNKNEMWINEMQERYNAKRITLKQNLRNSDTIIKLSTHFGSKSDMINNLNKSSSIQGQECYHYHNIYNLDGDILAQKAILKYFPNIEEPVVIINEFFGSANTHTVYQRLKSHFSSSRKIFSIFDADNNDLRAYIENQEGILITDIECFHGAQARNVIIMTENVNSVRLRNIILRTMSFAIIIHNRELQKEVQGLVRDYDLHENIQHDCYHYNNVECVSKNIVARAIVNKYFLNNPSENICFLTNDCEESISNELNTIFSNRRHIVSLPYPETDEDRDIMKYTEDANNVLQVQGSILITNLLNVDVDNMYKWELQQILEKSNSFVIFSCKEQKEKPSIVINTILKKKPFSVVVHDNNIDAFKPIFNMVEIKDLKEFTEEQKSN